MNVLHVLVEQEEHHEFSNELMMVGTVDSWVGRWCSYSGLGVLHVHDEHEEQGLNVVVLVVGI